MEIIRDPVWQFIGALLTILVPVVSWWFVVRKKEKSLTYEVSVNFSLLSISEEVKSKIKILYGDRPVENLYVLVVKLSNDGRIPILPTDFLEPIALAFSGNAKLLSAEVTETIPPELHSQVSFSIEPEKVIVKPTLLNQNDVIIIKVLGEAPDRSFDFEVQARIVGVSQIKEKIRSPQINDRLQYFSKVFCATLSGIFVYLVIWILWQFRIGTNFFFVYFSIVFSVGVAVMAKERFELLVLRFLRAFFG